MKTVRHYPDVHQPELQRLKGGRYDYIIWFVFMIVNASYQLSPLFATDT